MNQKFAKFTRTLFIIFMVLFLLFSIPMAVISIYAFLFTVLCAFGCYLISRNIKKKYILKKEPFEHTSNTVTKITKTTTNPKISDGEMNYNLFEDFVNGNILIYEYEENIFLNSNSIELIKDKGGYNITFCQEPENQYDTNAIAIYLCNEKIGYVYRGRIQDMINDWIKRNHLFCGHINKYSITNNSASYKIGFYKPISDYQNKRFPLTKISKKCDEYSSSSRYENLCECNDGDFVIIDVDYENNYIVTTEFAEEIGELPKSAINFIESGKAPKKIIGILDGCDDDYNYDNEIKTKPHVTVYLIK